MSREITKMAAVLFAALAIISCCDDTGGGGGANNALDSELRAKWVIYDALSPYASIEFLSDGHYLVVMNGADLRSGASGFQRKLLPGGSYWASLKFATRTYIQETNFLPIHYGVCRMKGEQVIMQDFGTVDIISVEPEEFTFALSREGTDETEEYLAVKATESIPSSDRSELFCRAWTYEKVELAEDDMPDEIKELLRSEYGSNWKAEVEKILTDLSAGITFIPSNTGSFFAISQDKKEAAIGEWDWADTNEESYYYSEEGDNWFALIEELSSTKLVTRENGYTISYFVPAK
ncbi:MAG: hypothetical protein LBQ73_10735 [Tannerellaceae bacterium]|nr:hypothetical protein [Tannerellaceae bacterium]